MRGNKNDKSGSFSELGLSSLFLEALAKRKIINPTQIQKEAIPKLLAGESFIFRSSTGTGKTFAYLLPLLEKIAQLSGDAKAGVLNETAELGSVTNETEKKLGSMTTENASRDRTSVVQ
jgi:superfamily II DNA/RNA helicase